MSTVIDLHGRHLLTLAEYSAEEITFLLDLAAELKAAKKEGREEQRLQGKEIALIFRRTRRAPVAHSRSPPMTRART